MDQAVVQKTALCNIGMY